MKFVGAHVSAAGGVENAPLNARRIGARAFALFTKNQRQWQAKPLAAETVAAFKRSLAESGIATRHVLPHDSYLINLGHPDPQKRLKSENALLDEARRAEQLGLALLNFHPGSHLGAMGDQECLDQIAAAMTRILAQTERIALLVEGTSGQGNHVGHRFEHLARILERVGDRRRCGVCLDTCHLFAAGYDLRTPEAYEATLSRFGALVGMENLRAVHLNDAKADLGSRKDRHDSIGKGRLGLETFRLLMNDPRLDDLPLILETIDESLWPAEIRLLYSLAAAPDAAGRGSAP